MEKQELLRNIKASLERGIITRGDLIELSDVAESRTLSGESKRHLNISEILYYLGGLIVFIGLVIFVGQNWNRLPNAARVLVTLGAGLAMYVSGILLSQYKNFERPAIGFHLIAALLIPGGIFVAFDTAGVAITLWHATLVSLALFVMYLASFLVYRKNLFLLLALIFGTGFYFLLTDFMMQNSPSMFSRDISLYRVLLLGLTYMSLGTYFRDRESLTGQVAPTLVGFVNSLGVITFLGAAFALIGYKPDVNMFWQIIFPGLALGVVFLSIYQKSRAYLVFGTLFFMGYIFKLSAEYFATALGFSLTLIIIGFVFIGIGYAAFAVNKKYLGNQ